VPGCLVNWCHSSGVHVGRSFLIRARRVVGVGTGGGMGWWGTDGGSILVLNPVRCGSVVMGLVAIGGVSVGWACW